MTDGSVYEEDVPTHTIHMRKALRYCLDLNEQAMLHVKEGLVQQDITDRPQQQHGDNIRHTSLEDFYRDYAPYGTLPIVDILKDNDATEFRQAFHRRNLPCLIRGLDQREFSSITKQWTSIVEKNGRSIINADWFLQHLGADAKVPVRKQPIATTTTLDSDGRAQECETLQWTMQEWIDEATSIDSKPYLYLKDWHLVKQLQREQTPVDGSKAEATATSAYCDDKSLDDNVLYTVPAIFQHDILNTFLTRATDGDYRFVYWGPAGSETPLHSDVMHSFSWSYNVVGHKRWTFYPPSLDASTSPDHTISIVQDQYAGECMFVPSEWKHEVVNMEETLSINHNWVTSANVDRLMASIDTERVAVDEECLSWGIDAWDAREHMLRGCAGLDMTACFLMLWSSLLDALLDCCTGGADCEYLVTNDDIELIQAALKKLLSHNDNVGLQQRLAGVLISEEMAQEALGKIDALLHVLAASA